MGFTATRLLNKPPEMPISSRGTQKTASRYSKCPEPHPLGKCDRFSEGKMVNTRQLWDDPDERITKDFTASIITRLHEALLQQMERTEGINREIKLILKKKTPSGFPWWPCGEESTCQRRGRELDPRPRKTHWAATPRQRARMLQSPHPAIRRSPHSLQREKPELSKRPSTATNKCTDKLLKVNLQNCKI